MNKEKNNLEQYITNFEIFEKNLNGQKDRPVHQLRKNAFDRFLSQGFPNQREEEWRFTNITPLLNRKFSVNLAGIDSTVTRSQVKPFLYKEWPGSELVFINGSFSSQLSSLKQGSDLLKIGYLAEMLTSEEEILKTFMDYGNYKEDAFIALNNAFLYDGALIKVADNRVLEHPVHIIYLNTPNLEDQVIHPRNLIFLGKNSQATIVESYFNLAENVYFNNTVTEIRLNEEARLNHIRIQAESTKAYHIGNVYVDQNRSSHYFSTSVTFGGALSRINIAARLNGEGCECTLNGLYMGHGQQLIDNHTFLDHVKPHCNSHEVYQGILSDRANGVFSGKILVRQEAQKTDAKQSNNCLLLSDEAQINSKPQLEIYADDVRCTHGATVGQLDEDAIFYLRSRGIAEQRAKNILTYAFAEQVIEGIHISSVREKVDKNVLRRLKEDMNFIK